MPKGSYSLAEAARVRTLLRLVPATAILVSLLGIGSAVAQGFCATRAIGKDGKPLAGAARTAFMKQCCEATALDKDGKPLEGAARASYLEKCEGAFSAPDERG
jgi:hypothetical protein